MPGNYPTEVANWSVKTLVKGSR